MFSEAEGKIGCMSDYFQIHVAAFMLPPHTKIDHLIALTLNGPPYTVTFKANLDASPLPPSPYNMVQTPFNPSPLPK